MVTLAEQLDEIIAMSESVGWITESMRWTEHKRDLAVGGYLRNEFYSDAPSSPQRAIGAATCARCGQSASTRAVRLGQAMIKLYAFAEMQAGLQLIDRTQAWRGDRDEIRSKNPLSNAPAVCWCNPMTREPEAITARPSRDEHLTTQEG